ncbi:MAG: hypothetical protein ACK5YA_01050, partial [bacterium]
MKKHLIKYTSLLNKFQLTSTKTASSYKNFIFSSIRYLYKNGHINKYSGTFFEGYYFNDIILEIVLNNHQSQSFQYKLLNSKDSYQIFKC